ncbi:Ail/Lom family outer membrane beta-barrel protein [Arsenophonus nasoniae]|uniref:Ail/Lom family outer membrane beta-barrel protein n=1 Tax=Arsenophonus nasoniae TaxID=638 RepID=UPI003879C035
MKKTLVISSIISTVALISANAHASKENTISVGYAQSSAKLGVKGGNIDLDDNAKGLNIKLRYEIDNNWGAIGSFTYTHKGYNFNGGYAKGDIDYYAWNVGPAYRFNEYVSVYGLVGIGHGKAEIKSPIYSDSDSETGLAYGAGLQFNPVKNIAIDASYEYSKLGDLKVGTWMLGVGYRF